MNDIALIFKEVIEELPIEALEIMEEALLKKKHDNAISKAISFIRSEKARKLKTA